MAADPHPSESPGLVSGAPSSPIISRSIEPLVTLGWDSRRADDFARAAAAGDLPGRVVRVDRGSALVATPSGVIRAEPSPLLLARRGVEAVLATGDWVVVHPRPAHATAEVHAILPRTSAFIRGDPDESSAQVLASNVDTAFIVHAASSPPNPRRLERELALVWQSGAAAAVVLTKADLSAEPESAVRAAQSAAPGVPVHLVCSVDGQGIDVLRDYTAGSRTVALIGASGVGKSTLVNRLVGEQVLATGAVRASDDRGRHTTTARHLVAVPGGGALLDTPGMRSVSLWGGADGMARAFEDMEALIAQCRFANCAHRGEPGCAVRAAIDAGAIDESRAEAYRKLQREIAHERTAQDARARREAKQSARSMERTLRQRRRAPGNKWYQDDA